MFLTLLSLTPLWLIVIKWIGKPDPILIAGLFLCWAFRSRWRVAIALMMVLAHREAGSVMVAAFYLSEKKKDHNLFVSLLVGNALHMLYQYGMLDYAPESRPEVMLDKIPDFLRAIVNMPTLYVMSMLTWYWVIILKRGLTAAEAGVMLMAACMAFLLEDFTRDFILAALPALLFHAARLAQSSDGTAWKKLWPLAPLQFQIATLGHVAFTRNIFLDLILRSHGR